MLPCGSPCPLHAWRSGVGPENGGPREKWENGVQDVELVGDWVSLFVFFSFFFYVHVIKTLSGCPWTLAPGSRQAEILEPELFGFPSSLCQEKLFRRKSNCCPSQKMELRCFQTLSSFLSQRNAFSTLNRSSRWKSPGHSHLCGVPL